MWFFLGPRVEASPHSGLSDSAMLTTLRIKNLALVSNLTLEFQPGFVAITGETGAGKSILMGALKLVLGDRADRTLIRGGCEVCTVEAVFELPAYPPALGALLDENGLERGEGGQLVLKRSFTSAGSNRQFVNGSATTVAVLQEVSAGLVDLHGPHDHQSLLHTARQLQLLDAFAGLDPVRQAFTDLVGTFRQLDASIAGLITDEASYSRQLDLLRHQVREISDAGFRPDEESELDAEYQRVRNSARILELCSAAVGCLSGDDGASLSSMHASLGRILQDLQKVDPGAACLQSLHEQSRDALRDLESDLSHYADRVDADPARLAAVEERVSLLQSLKRKYGGSVPEILAAGESARQRLTVLESQEGELVRLTAERARIWKRVLADGSKLSAARQKAAPGFARAVERQLADLGFKRAHFEVRITSSPPGPGEMGPVSPSGFDSAEFLFAPNVGESPRPLRAIASSGELSRVMLGLKTVLAGVDDIPVLVFDEVDANVGGETARVVGIKMRGIGAGHQVLCITHLAPVAAAAGSHLLVSKEVRDGRTLSSIEVLHGEARVVEIARMLGGTDAAAVRHAESLLKAARSES